MVICVESVVSAVVQSAGIVRIVPTESKGSSPQHAGAGSEVWNGCRDLFLATNRKTFNLSLQTSKYLCV